MSRTIFGCALGCLLILAGCRGEPSVASKSAAAYREAQEKGLPVQGGHDHGDHAAGHQARTAQGTAPMDHHEGQAIPSHEAQGGTSAHEGMTHSGSAQSGAMDHAAMGHGAAAGDHAQHQASGAKASGGHAGTQHGAAGAASHAQHGSGATSSTQHTQHAQPAQPAQHTQHSTTGETTPRPADPHAGHTMGTATTRPAPPTAAAPRSTSDVRRVQPAATLRPDAFDAPVPISVQEAAKSAGGGHAGHGTSGDTPAVDHSRHDNGSGIRETAVYTCPMHPEVTSDRPGTCPKCGMDLVRKN